MPILPIGSNSTPGHLVGEGDGRLLNCWVEKNGDKFYIRRVAGLASVGSLGGSAPRGLINIDEVLFAVCGTSVYRNGVALAGSIPGSDAVTMAFNNRVTSGVSTRDLVIVREGGGAFWVDVASNTLAAYPDADLPATVNSVSFLGGYFLFSIRDGREFASDLNTTAIQALSFATAESRPDGLKRGMVHGGVFYALGDNTIEPWVNAGNSPFPLARATSIIPVGILTTMAVAGFEDGWALNPFIVASDNTVREINGYDTRVVSTPDVERFVKSSVVSTIEVSAYTVAGRSMLAISSNLGTWEFDVGARFWHERLSFGTTRWRGCRTVLVGGSWACGDLLSSSLLRISDRVFAEAGAPLAMMIESAPVKEFPIRAAIAALFGDFTMGIAASVLIQWSHDGGRTWCAGLTRSLAPPVGPIRVNNLGLASHHGLRVRFTITDAVDVAFMGGTVEGVEVRKP
jgi:hypothetical protein